MLFRSVMNYLKYLQDARLINMLYKVGVNFPKKPDKVYMSNTNIMFPMKLGEVDRQALCETFFYNQLNVVAKVNKSGRESQFLVNDKKHFKVELQNKIDERNRNTRNSTFIKGDFTSFKELMRVNKPMNVTVYIVQPGVSISKPMKEEYGTILSSANYFIRNSGRVKKLKILGSS